MGNNLITLCIHNESDVNSDVILNHILNDSSVKNIDTINSHEITRSEEQGTTLLLDTGTDVFYTSKTLNSKTSYIFVENTNTDYDSMLMEFNTFDNRCGAVLKITKEKGKNLISLTTGINWTTSSQADNDIDTTLYKIEELIESLAEHVWAHTNTCVIL